MGESSAASERTPEERRESFLSLIAAVDKTMPSPEVRARKVWDALQKEGLNLWDLACFCVESVGYMSSVIPEFEPAAKQLSLQLYAHHYQASAMILEWSSMPENQLGEVDPEKLNKPPT